MNKSENINHLATALAKVQAKLPKVAFDAKNPFLKNSYATLGALVGSSLPIIAEVGLSIVQFPTSQEGRVGVHSILMHESGEYLEDTVTLVPEVQKGLSINQAAGVTITYLRRYSWASILGLISDEDNDGDTHAVTGENAEANSKVSAFMNDQRQWTSEQTEAVSKLCLDEGLEPMTAEDVAQILQYSVLPVTVPAKTVASWFSHYLKGEGSVLEKAADANQAYQKAKKSGGK